MSGDVCLGPPRRAAGGRTAGVAGRHCLSDSVARLATSSAFAITRASLLLLPGAVLTGVARSLFGADIRAIDAVNTPTETRVFCFQSARTRSGGLLALSVGDTLLRLDYSTYSGRVLSTKASCVAFLSRICA